MYDPSFNQFIADRDAALRSLAVDRVIEVYRKYNPGQPIPERDIVEIGMHKARTALRTLPKKERRLSKKWLIERGYSPASP